MVKCEVCNNEQEDGKHCKQCGHILVEITEIETEYELQRLSDYITQYVRKIHILHQDIALAGFIDVGSEKQALMVQEVSDPAPERKKSILKCNICDLYILELNRDIDFREFELLPKFIDKIKQHYKQEHV